MKDYSIYLADIIEAMAKIQRYTDGLTFESFAANEMVVDAVNRNLEIIGEAARSIPESIRNSNSQIPWQRMIGLRNIVIHEYFGIDLNIVWEIVRVNIPETRPLMEAMLKAMED